MRSIVNIFLLLLLSFFGGYAQGLQFEKLTIKDELSDNSVRDILQDSRGYLWLATLNGLDRYDGKGFRNYSSILGDETSLTNSRIQNILEDAKGFIWCLTLDGLVSRVDPATNQVLDIYPHFLPAPLPITDFKLMSSGTLWLWGGSTCIQIQYLSDKSEPKTTVYNHQNYLPNSPITFVHEDTHQNTWIGTEGGLVRLVQKAAGKEVFSNYLEGQHISSFAEGKEEIWFGTLKDGLKNFNFENNNISSLSPTLKASLTNSPILYIQALADQYLLLGSTQAIYELDIKAKTVRKYDHPSLRNVTHIRTDSQNNHWISAENRGIYKYDSSEKKLKYFDLGADDRSFLGDTDKQTFFEDSYGGFWVGIYGGGLYLYDRGGDKLIPYSYTENQQNTISSNQVLCLFEDNSKNMWVGTMYGGVNKLTRSNPAFTWVQPLEQPKHSFANEIRAATTDLGGNLWMGSKGGKIFCYNSDFKKIRTFPDDLPPVIRAQLNKISVYCLHFDGSNNLWIGTKGKGVFVLKNVRENNTASVEILHFDKDFKAANTSGLDEVFSIQEDAKGQFWIGSHYSGLTLLQNPFTAPQFSRYTRSNTGGKLVSNYIRYLTLDDDLNLWVGTSHGISILTAEQLDKNDKRCLSLTNDKSQLASLSYNSVDYIFQAEDKTMYVATMGGGINKLVIVNWEEEQFQWKFYNKSMGLSTNKVYAFEEDAQHNLWISTSLGINKFNPVTETFERFYKSENSSGLGLFFVKELVLLHKGKIEVLSEANQGTTFNLNLPIYKSGYEAKEIANTRPPLDPATPPIVAGLPITEPEAVSQSHSDQILIIDDNEEMRNYIGNKLKSKYQVRQAANGEEGFRLAIQDRPDIIICDLMMPVLDGIATTGALRRNFNTSHIPIILLTANSAAEKRFEGIETGADDYITKPFDYAYLLLKIESLIQQRKQLRTHFQQAPELSADTLTRSDLDKIFIQKVTDIINQNLGIAAFSVELLAKKMNCSRTNFYKKMRGVTGETPHEFIRTIQMKKAALLLKETNHSVADIGYMVGYNDSNYFSKSFKKHFGKTPKTYQKEEWIKTESLP